ncbi:MAG: hypothetical protein KC441_05250 [Anaerolineales bacterium]|nr:hypothetical protein [Anaerolineales bacterium]
MFKKQLLFTVLLSSALTIAVLAIFFFWGGFVVAQSGDVETGEGLTYPVAAGSLPAAPLATDSSMSHWSILGSHLLPRGSGMSYSYGGNGCLYVTNNGGIVRMQAPVILPDGSIIKSMDVDYYDTSASDLTVWLTSYEPGISNLDLFAVSSTGDAGFGTASSTEITHTVNNNTLAYTLNYSWNGVENNTLQICGIRINYIDPFFASFLPATVKN